jgi:poly(3-hydroxybutyrate) depolymerase
MNLLAITASCVSLVLAIPLVGRAQETPVDRGLQGFWRDRDASDRERDSALLERQDAPFDLLYSRLSAGPAYSRDVKTGRIEESREGTGGLRQEYVFLVPNDYDPAKRYRVCFYLHGGVSRDKPWNRGDSWWRRFDRLDDVPQISVFPASWSGSLWWQSSQIENLNAILDRLKTEYNVDENRVYLFGVSDGGTGAYYHAMKAPTDWAAFFPFIGHPGLLENPASGVDGLVFLGNFVNRPFYIVNAEADRLYPVERVRPYIEAFQRAGVELTFRPQPGGHDTRWWKGEQERIEEFMRAHVRKPYPDHLVWMTERTDRFARIHWLVIDELESGGEGSVGGIELTRDGNRVQVTARGVSRYRLLISPGQFDLALPVKVVTNGLSLFQGRVEPSSRTLLQWAARDFDRTMLFGAEIDIEVPPRTDTPGQR